MDMGMDWKFHIHGKPEKKRKNVIQKFQVSEPGLFTTGSLHYSFKTIRYACNIIEKC